MSDKVLKNYAGKSRGTVWGLIDEEISDFLSKFRSYVEKYGKDCSKYTEPINNAASIIVSEADHYFQKLS